MNLRRGISAPTDEDFQFMGTWIPITTARPTPSRSHPIPIDPLANHLHGTNWQQLPGTSSEHAQMRASYNGMNQTVSQIGQLHRNGGYYGFDGGLAENNGMINHIAGSSYYTQLLCNGSSSWNNSIPLSLLTDEAAIVASTNRTSIDMATNTPLIPMLHSQVANQGNYSDTFLLTNQNWNNGSYPSSMVTSRPLIMDSSMMASRPLIMNSRMVSRTLMMDSSTVTSRHPIMESSTSTSRHPIMDSSMVTSRPLTMDSSMVTSRPLIMESSMVMSRPPIMDFHSQVDNNQRDYNSGNWFLRNQNQCSSSNPLSNGSSSSQLCQYGFPMPLRPSYDLNSSPRTETDATSCVDSRLQCTTDQAKNLENNELSAILKSLIDESASKIKDKQVMSIGDEAIQKRSDELLQNIVESSSAAILTPYKENKDSDRESDQGIDLNKTPQQKAPKRRKHRPKVIIEGKPKRTPKPAAREIPESKETRPGKRKYVRKNVQKDSTSQFGEATRETTNARKGARRVLNFDLEKTIDENQGKTVAQKEEMQQGNKRTLDLTLKSQVTDMGTGTNHVSKKKSAERIGVQNELMVESQIPGTMNNPTPSMNHVPNNYIFLPERLESAAPLVTTKDVQMKNLQALGRHTDNGNSDLCQRRCRYGYTPMQQHSQAEGIGQDVIQANTDGENLEKTKEKINQGGSQSVLQVLSPPRKGRGSKRGYSHTIEHTHRSTNNPPSSLLCQDIVQLNDHQRNGCTLSTEFSERHKKRKFENGGYDMNIYDNPCKVTPVEKCVGNVERKRANDANPNGFASKLNHTILSSYIESSRMAEKQKNGINKLTSDRYIHSMASGHNSLEQRISSKSHSYQEDTQVHSFSTQSAIETCNQLVSSLPRKSFQRENRQVFHNCDENMSAKQQTVGPTVSESVSSITDKALQEQDAIGLPIRTIYPAPVDDIIHRFNGLNLNESCSRLQEQEQEQNALVPYKGDGAVVPYEERKKRKPRPKVELDPETNRIWNLLMGKEGSGDMEGTDKKKEKYWEEERKVFQGRAESFIARMHLVQGDRRFSQWKGSVVDSVIGVFLTQNVSDHLSSSAFMSLAARFPLNSKNNHQSQDKVRTVVKEAKVHMTSPEDATKWHEEISSKPIYSQISLTLHESAEHKRKSEASQKLVEAHSQGLEEVFISSQDSFDSSVTQGTGGITSYLVSNSEAEYPTTGCNPNKIHTSLTYQQMDKATMFQDFYYQVNGSSIINDGSKHGHIEYGQLNTRSDRIDHLNGTSSFTNPINLDNQKMQPPLAPSSNNQLHMYPDSGEPELWGFEDFSEESISCWPSIASRLNMERDENSKSLRNKELSGSVVSSSVQQNILWRSQETPLEDPYASFRQHSTDQQNNYQPRSSNEYNQPSCNSHQQERNQTFKLDNTSATEPVKHTAREHNRSMHVPNVSELKKKSFNGVDSVSAVNKQRHFENRSVDSNSEEQLYSYRQSHNETITNISKGKKRKSGSKKKSAFDWDILRKQVQANGGKKERNKEAMDSLDYEAIRHAKVKEISDVIKERGMNNMLAERIQEFLNRLVKQHGSMDLEWLREVPPDQAKDYLLSIRGLGLKSVECVRLLTLHHVAFPVDTNVGRIAVRLGWVPLQPLPESLQLHLLEMYPMLESIQKYLWPRLCELDQLTLYELHYQMITFGKVFCTKNNPNCNACPMRGECRHFASAFASARLALPGPEEKNIVSSTISIAPEKNPTVAVNPMLLPPPEGNSLQKARAESNKCEPIIEEPATPEQEFTELSQSDIEDLFYEDPDEIPTIKLNMKEFTMTLQNYMQEKMELQDGDMSKALVALNQEVASIPTAKLKNISRLRTEHQVYEIPDSHPLLEEMDRREPHDPSPYLLAIWTPGETANSIQPPERCGSQDQNKLCNQKTCFSCNSIREADSQTVRGTILIPCRTAMNGSFPLNGTYFQVNEMFADHESSENPIHVPRGWIWNLPRRTVYFGTSVSTIFRGLSIEGIQYCFWRGYVCVRGFDRKTRAPRPLVARLHFPASKKLTKTKNEENGQNIP